MRPLLPRLTLRTASTVATGALLALTSLAYAAPEIPDHSTVAVHLGKGGLDLIGKVALQKVPPHIVIPDVQKDLGIGGMVASVSSASLDVAPHSLTFEPQDGALAIATSLDLSGSAHVVITHGYSGGSTAACDVSFSATDLSANAGISVAVSDGQPATTLGAVGVSVPDGQLHIVFSNCALANLSGGAVDATGQKLLELSQGLLGDQLRAAVPPLVDAQLATMLTKSGSFSGYGFAGALTTLTMNEYGIDAYASIGVDYEGPAAECLPPGAATTKSATLTGRGALRLPQQSDSAIVVGVTTELVSNAVSAAWQAGLLCVDDSKIAALGFDPSSMVKLVPGLPEGLSMSVSMGIDTPPTFSTTKDGGILMHVKGAELLLALTSPNAKPSGIAVGTDFSVAVTPQVDTQSGAIYAQLGAMTMERLDVHAGASGTSYELDPERLTVLVQDVIAPLAVQKLKDMPLAPTAFGAAGVYTWLTGIDAHDDGLYVSLEGFTPPSTPDHAAPLTLLEKAPPGLVRAGLVPFQVGGGDDITPPELMRYEWQVDNGPIGQPAFGRVLAAPVAQGGKHVLRVRAVDLAGNFDPEWQQSFFEVDPTPPTLQLDSQPPAAVRASSVTIDISGADDRGPDRLTYAYRLSKREPGGQLTFVSTSERIALDHGIGHVKVDKLKDGTTYEVTLMLYDEAGNVTSQKVGFGVAGIGGCAVGDGPVPLDSLVLVLGALVCVITRRRFA